MTSSSDGARAGARGYEGFRGHVAEASSQSTPAWEPPIRARRGAPNVLLVLMDDMGFSDIGPFGAEIATEHLNELADQGYRFTNYHTNPLCTPARASLLTGLNPHRAGFSTVVHADPGYPGYTLQIGDDVPTVAESFRAGGYATFMVGKWHLSKESLMHDAADKSSWPLQRGFDRYYGCMDGFTTLFSPHRLVADNSPVVRDEFPEDYYLTDDLTDQALAMIKALRASDPDKPFFCYLAHQAVHGPIQAKPEDIAAYRGMYDAGWDHIRSARYRRQIAQGLFPETTRLPEAETGPGLDVPAWEDLTEEQRTRFARYMEVYAAAIDSVDQNLGRLIAHLKRTGEYENTIIAFTSDNGGTAEGGPEGTRSYFSQFVEVADLPQRWQRDVPRDVDLLGGPRMMVHYPRGWAHTSNTPFRLYKGHTFEGGIHAPLLISWPGGLPRHAGDGGVRDQFTYVSDLGLTLLELAGVPHLDQRCGQPAREVDGVGFAAVLRDQHADPPRREQYAEIMGRRAYFRDQWKIVTHHTPGTAVSDSEWELYDLCADPTETQNLAAQRPELVAELGRAWQEAAWHNTVFPLGDDASLFTVRPATELVLEQPVTLYPGTPTLERFRSAKLIRMRDVAIDAEFVLDDGDAGVLVSHGDQGGGYVLFVEGGRLCFRYNQYGEMVRVVGPATAPGRRHVRVQFTCGPEIDWRVQLRLDGAPAGELASVLQLIGMSPFTGISVGVDRGSPVDWDLFERHGSFAFTGQDLAVTYTPGEKAPYNTEVIRSVEREVERICE